MCGRRGKGRGGRGGRRVCGMSGAGEEGERGMVMSRERRQSGKVSEIEIEAGQTGG